MLKKKKPITGSNKFPHNGLKNKMLPKQVQPRACVQKPYGRWACVGVLVSGAECPLLPGATLGTSRHRAGGGRNRQHGRAAEPLPAPAPACACSAAGERACTGVCRCAGGAVSLFRSPLIRQEAASYRQRSLPSTEGCVPLAVGDGGTAVWEGTLPRG